MKRSVWTLLAAALLPLLLLAGCGGQEIEVYNTGLFTVSVPEDWLPLAVDDMWSEDPNAVAADQLNLVKGGKDQWDLMEMPSVHIACFDPGIEMVRPDPSLYREVEELAPLTGGEKTYEGMKGVSSGL
ncbi:MAG: hypothetical protein IJF59_06115, partial [Clostridia bacterium]|nr:hypothetical protein [Clostridia bacterium]